MRYIVCDYLCDLVTKDINHKVSYKLETLVP